MSRLNNAIMKQHAAIITWALMAFLPGFVGGQEAGGNGVGENGSKVVLIQFGTPAHPKDIAPSSESYFERKLAQAEALF